MNFLIFGGHLGSFLRRAVGNRLDQTPGETKTITNNYDELRSILLLRQEEATSKKEVDHSHLICAESFGCLIDFLQNDTENTKYENPLLKI